MLLNVLLPEHSPPGREERDLSQEEWIPLSRVDVEAGAKVAGAPGVFGVKLEVNDTW